MKDCLEINWILSKWHSVHYICSLEQRKKIFATWIWSLKNSAAETLYPYRVAFPDSLIPATCLLSNSIMCRILQSVKGNILPTEDISGFMYLSLIYLSSNIYWTSTMSDIHHLAKKTRCVSSLYGGAEIYKQVRCWFCTQILWDGKYQERKTGLGARLPWSKSRPTLGYWAGVGRQQKIQSCAAR